MHKLNQIKLKLCYGAFHVIQSGTESGLAKGSQDKPNKSVTVTKI